MREFQHNLAKFTLKEMEDLISAASSTPPPRHLWRPMETGRHVLDIIQECGAVNARWGEMLHQREWVMWPLERYIERREQLTSLELATEQLRQDTEYFVAQLEHLRDDELETMVQFPSYQTSLARIAIHPAVHMAYHEGQINYIQTLYGDWGRHY